MAKKSWFSLLKRLFFSDTHSNREKKEKRKRWVFGKIKIKRLISISSPSPSRERILSEAEEEQRKHAVTVAIETAAAADAAVSAVQVAAEVVWLTGSPQSTHKTEEDTQEFSTINMQFNAVPSTHQYEKEIQDHAATKIQTVFRGYLARKALRALKALVRLQAIIRGRAVRRQAITTLKSLQSIVNIQSQVCAKRFQLVEGALHCQENNELPEFKGKAIKVDLKGQRRWDDSLLTKEEVNALFSGKREAAIKRERIKEYSASHPRPTESEENKVNGRWSYWLEKWVDTQLAKREDLQNSDTNFASNAKIREELEGRQHKMRNFQNQYLIEGLDSPIYILRRSFHHIRRHSIGNDISSAGSPVFPTYMAATESAKLKARSMNSPRLRPLNLDAFSDTNSPCKHKLSPVFTSNSEVTSRSRIGNPSGGFSQKSPCLKGLPGPVKSNKTPRDLSFNSECSLPNWDRHGAFK